MQHSSPVSIRQFTSLAVLFLVTPSIGRSQDANTWMRMERARIQAEAESNSHWDAAKKLHVIKAVPDGPRRSLMRDKMTEKTVGLIESWMLTALQVVDSKNILLASKSSDPIWLEDFPTDGISDGQKIRVVGPIRVVGTKLYVTAAGTQKTVRLIRFLNEKEADEWEKERAQEAMEAEYPTWHSVAGTTVNAKFLRYAGGRVQLVKPDGSTISVKLGDFADEDADKLRLLIKESRNRR